MTTAGYYVQHTFSYACTQDIFFFPPFLGRVATLIALNTKWTCLWFSQWRMCDPEFKNLIYILNYGYIELTAVLHQKSQNVSSLAKKKNNKSFKWCDNLKLNFFSPVAKLIKTWHTECSINQYVV